MSNSISLYNLGKQHEALLSQLCNLETGEVNPEVDAQLTALSTTIKDKCLSVASWIKTMEAERSEIEYYKGEILKREKAYNEKISFAENYLKRSMEANHIKEIKCPFFTLKIKCNPYSTDVFDEGQVPSNFMRTREVIKTETKPDKNAIKEEVLRTGIQVPGARVEQKSKLQILTDEV